MAELFDVTVEDAVARIRALDPAVHMFINTRLDEALDDDKALKSESPRSVLHRVPFSLKDEFETRCLPTTGGSWRYRDRLPEKDSSLYEVFREAGAVLLGKTNLSDLGVGSEASSYVGGVTTSPFDRKRTAGGSSGGSAAAVANGCAGFDWGTDIGGSIRSPAAFCGVLGMRLSHETWPIRDLFPRVPPAMDWMCGQGPFTKTTDQMRAVLKVAAQRLRKGEDRPFEAQGVVIYPPDRGLWPRFVDDVRPHLETAIDGPVKLNESLDRPSKMFRVYASMWASHFEDLLESDPGLSLASGLSAVLSAVLFRGAFGDRRIHPTTAAILLLVALGRITLFGDKSEARARAFEIRDAFRRLWDEGVVIASPVTPYPPPYVSGASLRIPRYLNNNLLSCTVPGNLADATCLAIPFGTFDGRLPRSIQLMGPPGSEHEMLSIADRVMASRDRDPRLGQPKVSV
ncbi:MAG: amidase [Nitrospirae bacterium]|nr:amidase [Nitrospirota bacterium]